MTDFDVRVGERGLERLRHRGPNSGAHWMGREAGVFLGHRRLSIIDVSPESDQPAEYGDLVLSYNGEIYNYKELRQELISHGFGFETQGDVEVLAKGWIKWKGESVLKMDGMFAFALYDGDSLHLVTDFFGEKPLYVFQNQDGIYFASEINPLLELFKPPVTLSEEDTSFFLAFGFLPQSKTVYAGVRRLEPATHLVIRKGEITSEGRYWVPDPPRVLKRHPPPRLSNQDLDRISNALVESIGVRLRADVPLSVFLSSGVDSSLIAAICAKELKEEVTTFTVQFSGAEVADESVLAGRIAAHLKLPHQRVRSEGHSSRNAVSLYFGLYGEPVENLTALPSFEMCLAASDHFRVAITGLGGDEIFYGYNKYQWLYRYESFFRASPLLKSMLKRGLDLFFSERRFPIQKVLSLSPCLSFLASKNFESVDAIQNLRGIEEYSRRFFSGEGSLPQLARYFDLTQTLPNSFIPAIERSSMRASLEVRTPFLNRNLFEVVNSYDPRAFFMYGQKEPLRRILGRYLPVDLIDRSKKGFNSPVNPFLGMLGAPSSQVHGVPREFVSQVTENRTRRDWNRLALRLSIIDFFQSKLDYSLI